MVPKKYHKRMSPTLKTTVDQKGSLHMEERVASQPRRHDRRFVGVVATPPIVAVLPMDSGTGDAKTPFQLL